MSSHQHLRDNVKRNQSEHAGDREAPIESIHDFAAGARFDKVAADDRGQDGYAAEHERVDRRIQGDLRIGEQQCAENDRGDDGHRIGFEQVGSHAGAVADVVTDVVGDHRRVARIVFGYAGFHFADEIGAYVRAFGENAAAQTRENRDQRATECQTDQRMRNLRKRCAWRSAAKQYPEETRHTEQTKADHQQTGDRAAAKRNRQRFVQAGACSFGGAHVGAHRNVHADVARQPGQHRTERKAGRGCPLQR